MCLIQTVFFYRIQTEFLGVTYQFMLKTSSEISYMNQWTKFIEEKVKYVYIYTTLSGIKKRQRLKSGAGIAMRAWKPDEGKQITQQNYTR